MPRNVKLQANEILLSIKKITRYLMEFSFDEFRTNELVIDAVIRNLEVIGEAVKHMQNDVKSRYPQIEWKKIAGLRDILIHQYFSVDLEIIWEVIQIKLPQLKQIVIKLID